MAIGPLTAGPHTLKVVLDADQNVVESNGTDNTIERAINVTGTVAVTPNLSFYQPSGWASKVIVSKVTGTNTDNTGLLNTDTLYVDVTPHNSGTATISTPWTVKYYVDNEHFATWDIYTTLGANTIISNLVDKSIGYLPAGSHTLKVVLDANNAISESNESDNEFTRTVTVGGTNGSNLTLGQPPGWPYKILFCSSADSYTDQGDAWFNNQKIYLRGAPRNNGTTTITTLPVNGDYTSPAAQAAIATARDAAVHVFADWEARLNPGDTIVPGATLHRLLLNEGNGKF
eukprot:gene49983-61180_t